MGLGLGLGIDRYTPACTRMRLAQTQVWPAFRNLEPIAPCTASSLGLALALGLGLGLGIRLRLRLGLG